MRAHQIMTRNLVTVTPDTTIEVAGKMMVAHRVSGLPVINALGDLVGIVSERDFLRRTEIGTTRKRPRWVQFFLGPGSSAESFVHENGRLVGDIMTEDPATATEDTTLDAIVTLMETKHVKRIPIVRGARPVGIVTRSNIMQAVADLSVNFPDPTANDEHIHDRIIKAVDAQSWTPIGFRVHVRNGVVQLHGLIVDERSRNAVLVAARNLAGVSEVHDHLTYVDTWSGFYLESPEDRISH